MRDQRNSTSSGQEEESDKIKATLYNDVDGLPVPVRFRVVDIKTKCLMSVKIKALRVLVREDLIDSISMVNVDRVINGNPKITVHEESVLLEDYARDHFETSTMPIIIVSRKDSGRLFCAAVSDGTEFEGLQFVHRTVLSAWLRLRDLSETDEVQS